MKLGGLWDFHHGLLCVPSGALFLCVCRHRSLVGCLTTNPGLEVSEVRGPIAQLVRAPDS